MARREVKQSWDVELHEEFAPEFDDLPEEVQDNLLAAADAVRRVGPTAGRPYVDTLAGSKYANMRELRFEGHNGAEEWRAAFAFDPERKAIILVAGAKQGVSRKLFYKRLIAIADKRFGQHIKSLEAKPKDGGKAHGKKH